jgi:hypothetical protein
MLRAVCDLQPTRWTAPRTLQTGDLGAYRAFSVDGDLRVLFRGEDEAFLVNLVHDEVY